ncbi:MAG: DinB family protein [Caldilineaceae bacterium]
MQPYPMLETLFRHNLWANLRLLEACAALSEEQIQSTIIGVYGSIGDTWQHIVRAERSYFARVSTGQPYPAPENEPPLTFDQMAASLRRTGEGFIEWAPKVQAADRVETKWISGEIVQVPKAVILTQVINHATEHRAQIMAILTQLGIQPPELDSWSYFDAQGLQ